VTELDFDELDRAVNSLISGGPAGTQKEDAENVLTLPETPITDTIIPSVDPGALASPAVGPTDLSTPAVEDPLVASTPTLAAKRSSGRFMDVVHPSSDMRNTTSPSSFTRPNPVSPLPPVAVPDRPDTASIGSTDMPDPLAFSTAAPTPTTSPAPTVPESTDTEDDDIDKIANDITNSLKPEIAAVPEDEPALTSPFLPDTKVDKRPLGAFSDDTSSIASEMSAALSGAPAASATEVSTDPVPVPVQPLVPDQPEVKTDSQVAEAQVPEESAPLPEELQSDLLSIESTTATTSGVTETTPTEAPAPIQAATSVPTPEVTVGPTAITQQYKEEPSTGDKQSGAIFDTESYHKPLAQPAKKKKSFKLVPLVAGVIIVGAGIGAAVYYFVLPLV
jgi:hypothetical protein